jgi:hypothetical protein
VTALGLPLAILALPPLSIAAGIDLYLTLLCIGAAPTIGRGDGALPGALQDLDSPGVLIMVGTFYVLEFAAERFAPTALAWNAFHAVIRPVSGALLAFLLLDGQPTTVLVVGSLVGAVLASIAHAVRSGSAVLRWLGAGVAPSVLLVSIAEDVLVIGLVALALDAPAWALGLSALAILALGLQGRSLLGAFRYAVGLAAGYVFHSIRTQGWKDAHDLPGWVQGALENNDRLAPGGALRGTRAGGWRIAGTRRFLLGWVVVRGGTPVFVYRRLGSPGCIDLGAFGVDHILDQELYRRIDLRRSDQPAFLLFGSTGPSRESLIAEFGGW